MGSFFSTPLDRAAASLTLGAGSLDQPASASRRLLIGDVIFGSAESPPSDDIIKWQLQRHTTATTGTAVTISLMNKDGPAVTATAKDTLTAEGTPTANELPLTMPLNGRATWNWKARPGSEIIVPQVNNNGILFRTPVALNLPAVDVNVIHEE